MTNFLYSTGSTASTITSDGYSVIIDSVDVQTMVDETLGIPWSFIAASAELYVTAHAGFDGYAEEWQMGFGIKSNSYPTIDFIESSTPDIIVHRFDVVEGWDVTLDTDGAGILRIHVQGVDGRTIYWRSVLKLNIDITQIPS